MKEIMKYSICSMDKNSREETCMFLWVEEMGKEGKAWKNIIGIDVNDGMDDKLGTVSALKRRIKI